MADTRKRLMFFLHSLSVGGAERLVVQMAEQLEQHYDIAMVCMDEQGYLWQECEKRGYRLYLIGRSPGFSYKTFSRVAEAIRSFAPDILHAHQYTPYLYATVGKVLCRSKARLIFTEHGRHYPDVVSIRRRIANRLLIRFTDAITAVSNFSKSALYHNEGLRSLPIQVIYNGLHHESHSASSTVDLRTELQLEPDSRLIGYVGSLRPVKNPLFLLQAFEKIALQDPSAYLVYIGDGPLRRELESEISRRCLTDRVFMLGERTPATPYFTEFDVYVLPSLCEAASLALLEAMSVALPVIVTDRGGSPEIVEHQKSGVVVPCGDVEALSAQLLELLGDSEMAKRLAVSAQQRVSDQFSFETMMSQYQTVYEQRA